MAFDLSRRGFLSLLGLGGAGLLVPKWMVYEPEVLETATGHVVGLDAITASIASGIDRQLGNYKLQYVPHAAGAKLGQHFFGQAVMTDQRYVDFEVEPHEEVEWERRYVEPAAAYLAEAIRRKELTAISDLNPYISFGKATVARTPSGLSLRGSLVDIEPGHKRFRFDLIGGRERTSA